MDIHGYTLYSLAILGFEIQRKVFYPLLNKFGAFSIIVSIEQLPFRLFGNRIRRAGSENESVETRMLLGLLKTQDSH